MLLRYVTLLFALRVLRADFHCMNAELKSPGEIAIANAVEMSQAGSRAGGEQIKVWSKSKRCVPCCVGMDFFVPYSPNTEYGRDIMGVEKVRGK